MNFFKANIIASTVLMAGGFSAQCDCWSSGYWSTP